MADPLPPAGRRGPIFIVGAMGSGTTLLRLMLDSHDRLAVPQETGFMRTYNAFRFIPFKWSGRNWTKRLGWSQDELDELLRDLYETLFQRYVERHGKQRWGEKTPVHTWHIDNIAHLFPDAVFVGVVRHPGGSVASNMGRWKYSLAKAALHWRRYNSEIARQAARYPDRFVLLRYEDLVLRPEPVLRELLDWLGEPWSDGVLEHHVVQGSRGGRANVEGRSRVDDPIDVSRMDKWTRSLDPDTRASLAREAGRLGEFFGYSIEDPAILEPLTERESLLVGGAEVDARIDRFPDLDLRTQGVVPRYERLWHPREFMVVAVPPAAGGDSRGPLRRAAAPLVRRLPQGARRRLASAVRKR